MHRWEVGVLGVPAVWWSSRFRCGMDRGDEAVTDWSLMVGGPVIGGGGTRIYTFPIGVGGFDFGGIPSTLI